MIFKYPYNSIMDYRVEKTEMVKDLLREHHALGVRELNLADNKI
jgi:hypothetical protein